MDLTNKHDISFAVSITGFKGFRVISFSAIENLSDLFGIGIKIACPADKSLKPADLVDSLTTLTIHHKYKQLVYDGVYENAGISVPPREFNGVIESVEHVHTDYDWTTLNITVMPALHRLRHSSDCRIFQKIRVQDIVKKILGERGVTDFEFNLKDAVHQQEREFCVQYNETHLGFIQRLLAEEGIFYYFKHEGKKHIMVMTDMSQGGDKLKPNPLVEYNNQTGGMIKAQFVSQLSWRETMRPDKVAHREYCFTKPYYDQEHEKATGTTPMGDAIPTGHEKFTYHDRYKEPNQGKAFTQYQLESERADATQGNGTSNLIHFSAGKRFSLVYHKIEALNTDYLLVSVSHNGSQPQALENASGSGSTTYGNNFTVIQENTQPWRPARIHKPIINGSQIAHVVGPAGEEIYTDKYGRVKLHFMWDRYSKKNDTSSCWIRVSQAWAGRGYGMVAIPRIGHEVIVDFLEGDPDQPIVIGRTYHDGNPHPYPLPANKTQTGILTRSSKGGGASNANQLRFEDLKGQEQVYIHAERNQDNVVELDETTQIGRDRSENIGRDERINIGRDRTETVVRDENIRIGHDRTEHVVNNEDLSVGVNQRHLIGKNRISHVVKDEIIKIDNHRKLDVYVDQIITTGKDYSHTVNGKLDLKVGQKIKHLTTIHEVGAQEKVIIKAPGGTIIMDGGGITLKGKVEIKGSLAIMGGAPEMVEALQLSANTGEPICIDCMLEKAN